jgi:dTDP-4-amino-4,6-dideoxygalactose transaminase
VQVPFLDVRAGYEELRTEIDEAIARVLASGRYILGPEVEAFEEAFADHCGADHCIGVGNGLDALHLALLAVGVQPGDEVIVASNTFIATWLAVSYVGAVPVPVEPDAYHNLDAAKVEAAITSRTRAILPTHLYGQPADLDLLLEIARRHGLKLVEDAAQAHGAEYKGRRVGSHGDAVAWSFYPGKNLGALGDGGAVTTSNPQVAERVRLLGSYGSSTKYVHDLRGFNSRLDPIQAAILSVKLHHLDEWNARRARIAAIYSEALEGTGVETPLVPKWAKPSWHLYVVQSECRDDIAERLRDQGVDTLIHYPIPPHRQRAYGDTDHVLPVSDRLASRILSLPIGPHLSQAQVEWVADSLLAPSSGQRV